MKWIGLTGCMGCGKSTVARIIKEDYGVPVVSADEVALDILKNDHELHEFIQNEFQIKYDLDFSAYRSKISAKVFADKLALRKYEDFFHPKVKSEVKKIKESLSQKFSFAIYDVPLLFEKNMQSDFAAIIGVFADPDIQFQRLKERNQWTDQQIAERLNHQISNKKKIDQCDFLIFNNSTLENLKIQIASVMSNFTSH